jgi:hypothetical protein
VICNLGVTFCSLSNRVHIQLPRNWQWQGMRQLELPVHFTRMYG